MMLDFPWLDVAVLGNPLRLWIVAAATGTVLFFVLETAKVLVVRRLGGALRRPTDRIEPALIAIFRSFRVPTLAVIAVAFAVRILALPDPVVVSVRALLTLVLAVQAIATANVAIDRWVITKFTPHPAARGSTTGYGVVRFAARAVSWAAILLVALDNLGVQITTLIAGLGVGGVAVALAIQSILGDVFCSLSILLDEPFEIGDFIVVGELAGTVERVGVKTTRIRSLGGEQLVFANSDLVGSRIRNYKRMRERRICFEFGVTYQTTAEQAAEIPGVVRRIIDSLDSTRFDRAHFKAFGDSALVFEVVYFVLAPDYNAYMDTQQTINLALMRELARHGISFAYPTHTVYLQESASAVGETPASFSGGASPTGQPRA